MPKQSPSPSLTNAAASHVALATPASHSGDPDRLLTHVAFIFDRLRLRLVHLDAAVVHSFAMLSDWPDPASLDAWLHDNAHAVGAKYGFVVVPPGRHSNHAAGVLPESADASESAGISPATSGASAPASYCVKLAALHAPGGLGRAALEALDADARAALCNEVEDIIRAGPYASFASEADCRFDAADLRGLGLVREASVVVPVWDTGLLSSGKNPAPASSK